MGVFELLFSLSLCTLWWCCYVADFNTKCVLGLAERKMHNNWIGWLPYWKKHPEHYKNKDLGLEWMTSRDPGMTTVITSRTCNLKFDFVVHNNTLISPQDRQTHRKKEKLLIVMRALLNTPPCQLEAESFHSCLEAGPEHLNLWLSSSSNISL